MDIINKISHAVIKRIGNTKSKQAVWDMEFKSGKWNHIKSTESDIIYKYIEKYINNGIILDLGAGSGNTGIELNLHAYREYVGVDISVEAIKIAEERVKCVPERKKKNSYYIADIENYVPTKCVDVILFRESLYYIRKNSVISTLDRQMAYLNSGGVVIVRIHDGEKHVNLVNSISNKYNIIEKFENKNNKTVILVFNKGHE